MPNIKPLEKEIWLIDKKASFSALISCRQPKKYIFTLDIYSYLRYEHPKRHLGWWRLPLYKGKYKVQFNLDFSRIHRDSIMQRFENNTDIPIDCWYNENYEFDPMQDIQLVFRNSKGKVLLIQNVLMKVDKPAQKKKEFYQQVHAQEEYTVQGPFLPTLHLSKLAKLRKIFLKNIPKGAKVLDVSCGRSLFTEIDEEWTFQVFSFDIDRNLISQRSQVCPQNHWLVADALSIPFKNESFDVLFAGEIIEHLPDPVETLKEWRSMLKPDGLLIITTPNNQRLSNLIDGSTRPISPDHLRELSYAELKDDILPKAGFEIIDIKGVYLELFLNWFSHQPKYDYLQRKGNIPRNAYLIKFLCKLGSLFPRYALSLIFLCKKK
jgi:2-polyprenyl-3-methyl-5-hydroxy-6-metoxy-1,4-benzoquinol methylase